MNVETFEKIIDADYYTGVPDSQLKALCNYLIKRYGIDPNHHVIAANEGNCVALAVGYHLAIGKTPVVYMQNSGEGNIINPVASLVNEKVYAIPMIFVIGWRGQPGVQDEPQHLFQGEITLKLLEVLGISYFILSKTTTEDEFSRKMKEFRSELDKGKAVAIVVCKDALTYEEKVTYTSNYTMMREEVIRHVVHAAGADVIVATTGKASRELFEIREEEGQGHEHDFLTVGSMGHASSIALGLASHMPEKRVWCIDGDGAALMHMGALAVIGAVQPDNLIHIIINNGAHETVGGMPTVGDKIVFDTIAAACGYQRTVSVEQYEELKQELELAKQSGRLCMIEAKCALGARKNLRRPKTRALDNKINFMNFICNVTTQ